MNIGIVMSIFFTMPFVATNLPFQRQFRRKYVAVGAAGGVFISNCCNCSDLLLSCQYGSEPPSKLSIAYLSKDGSVASELVPCNFDAAFSSCCPSANANDLYVGENSTLNQILCLTCPSLSTTQTAKSTAYAKLAIRTS